MWAARLEKAERVLSESFAYFSCVALGFIVLLITLYVTGRYTGLIYFQFVEEWVGYLVVLIVVFSLGYTLRTGGHIHIDIVVRRIQSVKVRQSLAVVTSVLGLGLAIYLTVMAVSFMLVAWRTGGVSIFPSHTPMWIPRLFIPIGLVVFDFSLLIVCVRVVRELTSGAKGVKERKV